MLIANDSDTGGKDRTGVAAALILSLAGESPDDISKEYALSRIGVEPARESLTQKLTGGKAMDLYSERYQTIAKIEYALYAHRPSFGMVDIFIQSNDDSGFPGGVKQKTWKCRGLCPGHFTVQPYRDRDD